MAYSRGPIATERKQDALIAAVEALRQAVLAQAPPEGTWSYYAGVSGTVAISAGQQVVGITAIAGGGGATITINAGPSITVPAGGSMAISPNGQVVAPTIVFTGTASYVIEVITP